MFRYLLLVVFIIPTAQAAENYCHDPDVNNKWQVLMAKNGHHPEWQEIYKYRIKVCSAVDRGDMTLIEATERFEAMREEKIKALRERLEKEHGDTKGGSVRA